MQKQVLIGMSGGVDSSVAAFLLRQRFSCTGATMCLYGQSEESIRDAQAVSQKLEIDHKTFDYRAAFEQDVIRDFIQSYEQGLTPNPCIQCNRRLKFGALLRMAVDAGFDYVATGHYARVQYEPSSSRHLLRKAKDAKKDQTYFLACLDQHQLAHTLFPLGDLSKEEVRSIAEQQGFLNARKRDSQDICFVPGGDYVAFMEQYTGKTYSSGNYLDMDGNVIGCHKGAVCYTIGQRKGLGLALGAPAYVCRKDMQHNTVTLGPNEALFSDTLLADDWNWIPFPALTGPLRVEAKIRHSQFAQSATVFPEESGSARVVFDQPQRAISPGQAVVLYDGDIVIGGGTIRKAL